MSTAAEKAIKQAAKDARRKVRQALSAIPEAEALRKAQEARLTAVDKALARVALDAAGDEFRKAREVFLASQEAPK